ncbi:MAG TPA: double-strand break repair protein AddB, partial [Hyphomicrobiaceae bacterium]|nr:double-strand break repair protein AddB [Hyphomicrobiaceae bacterium]
MRAGCRIFTVPMGRPFLPALAEALLAGNLPVSGGARPSPMALSDVTLLLPTRRATRALQRALLAASGAPALLMPRIRQIIGGMDDGTASLLTGADDFVTDEAGTLRPAISDVARELALARLIVAWSEAERGGRDTEGGMAAYAPTAAATPAQAVRLARELARLMDAMEIEDVDLAAMQSLVPEALAEHWQKTLAFLR